jgi:hypothetical protein
MKRASLVLIMLLMVAGCAPSESFEQASARDGAPSPAASQKPDAVTERTKALQQAWFACLRTSYPIAKTQTPDKNAAAEIAFQSCATEEQAILAYFALFDGQFLFPPLKARTKSELISRG